MKDSFCIRFRYEIWFGVNALVPSYAVSACNYGSEWVENGKMGKLRNIQQPPPVWIWAGSPTNVVNKGCKISEKNIKKALCIWWVSGTYYAIHSKLMILHRGEWRVFYIIIPPFGQLGNPFQHSPCISMTGGRRWDSDFIVALYGKWTNSSPKTTENLTDRK